MKNEEEEFDKECGDKQRKSTQKARKHNALRNVIKKRKTESFKRRRNDQISKGEKESDPLSTQEETEEKEGRTMRYKEREEFKEKQRKKSENTMKEQNTVTEEEKPGAGGRQTMRK